MFRRTKRAIIVKLDRAMPPSFNQSRRHRHKTVDADAASTCSTASVSSKGSLHSSALSSHSGSAVPVDFSCSVDSSCSTVTYDGGDDDVLDQQPSAQRKRVMLSLEPRVHSIPIPTAEELRERWYDMHDYDEFKNSCLETIELVQKCRRKTLHDRPEDYCTRGLESFSRAGALRTKKHRNFAQQSVLKLQQQYHSKGLSNSAAIAEVYQKAAVKSVAVALSYGRKDEEHVYANQ